MERRELAREYLEHHSVMTLATGGAGGAAAAAVFYANRGLSLYFLSAPGTLHARNILTDPRVAVTIQDDARDWSAIRGLQLQGSVTLLDGAAQERARAVYAAKFPAIFAPAQLPPSIAAAFARIRWYRLDTHQLRYIDNSAGFGHTDEWSASEFG